MKWLILTLAITLLAGCAACSQTQQAQTRAQRQPLEKQRLAYKSLDGYEWREKGYNPDTGEMITYDHKPRVELLDEKAGKYAFKWVGFDGREKTVVFQRRDVIDAVVGATASKSSEGRYLYTYEVNNLPSSATFLKRFIVQSFASDVEPDGKGALFPGTMSNTIYEFREGSWISFADLSDDLQVDPGQVIRVQLTSSAPPGLVGCRVSPETVLEGADEHMPSALENLLPGYKEFPKGYTVGPVERLKSLSPVERAKYVLDNLPQFRKAGWITEETLREYERHLGSGDLDAVHERLDQDLRAEQITTEVFAIIAAMR